MTEKCLYMPQPEGTFRAKTERIFRRLSYDFWRRELKRVGLGKLPSGECTMVDVGCGPGFLIGCLEAWFPNAHMVGVDANTDLLEIAKDRCKRSRFLKGDACQIPLKDKSADVLFALHVIEHLPNPRDFFCEAQRVLKPNGILAIATPNADGIGSRLMKDKWVGYSDPTHIALNGPRFWRTILSETGFVVARDGTTGLRGVPWFDRMPLGLTHWVPTFFFGFFPWELGEAYICAAVSRND